MPTDRDIFCQAYIEAAVFAENDESDDFCNASMSDEGRRFLEERADIFFLAHMDDIRAYPEGVSQAGHDLWFTHNGHGVGFWEQNDPVSKRLDEAAHKLSNYTLSITDGQIYVEDI